MRFYKKFLVVASAGFIFACAGKFTTSTPLETLQAYTAAIKKKDAAQMKRLLSDASIKMAEQEAKSQNVPLDEIMKRETLFGENQRSVNYRNEKVDGDRATIEMKDSFDAWVTVPFVREEGVWKIDKQGLANQMMQQIQDENNKKFDDIINQSKQP
jgi:hypothetical protein